MDWINYEFYGGVANVWWNMSRLGNTIRSWSDQCSKTFSLASTRNAVCYSQFKTLVLDCEVKGNYADLL